MGNEELQKFLSKEKVPNLSKGVKDYANDEYLLKAQKPLPYFVLTKTGKEQAREISIRMRLGSDPKKPDLQHLRTIGWYGPPGTGGVRYLRSTRTRREMPLMLLLSDKCSAKDTAFFSLILTFQKAVFLRSLNSS